MTIYDKGCISNYRNCRLCYFSSVLYRILTEKAYHAFRQQAIKKYEDFREKTNKEYTEKEDA